MLTIVQVSTSCVGQMARALINAGIGVLRVESAKEESIFFGATAASDCI